MLSFLLDSPDGGISQNPRKFGPANTNTWKLIKQVNGFHEPTPHLTDNIYTNNGPSPLLAWSRGPLASKTQQAGKTWNEFRRALRSNYRDPVQSHINEYMANLTDKNEEKRDSPTLYLENTSPNPLAPHLTMNEQISIQEVGTVVKRLKNEKSPGDDSITNNMIEAGGTNMIQLLHLLYSSPWRWMSTPTQWREVLVKPIYKGKKKDKQDPDFAFAENNRLCVDSNVFSTRKPCDHNSDMTNRRRKRECYHNVIILS